MFSKWLVKWIETLTRPQQGCDMKYKFPLRCYKTSTSFLASEFSRDKSGFCKTTLEPSVLLSKNPFHLLVLVCEYLKSTHGFVPGYYHGQTMKEIIKMMVSRTAMITRTICLRQHCLCPWRWTPPLRYRLFPLLVVLKTGSWDPYLCKNLCMVCNGWCTVISNPLCLAKMVILGLRCMA